MQQVVTDKRLLNSLPNIAQFCHTGELEVFHNMLLKYCPKRQHIPYDSMKARLMLAAVDWNCQTRNQCQDADGNDIQDLIYSKRRKMWVSRKKYQTESHHLEGLMERVLDVKCKGEILPALIRPVKALPSHVASKVKPERKEAVIMSRFT